MPASRKRNERSWAIELIALIKKIAGSNDLIIKSAGGEDTLATDHTFKMFPDLLLFGDTDQNVILQGWEIKMPDIPIENADLIRDAQRKAIALGLNHCLIWNFTYAVLYKREGNNDFHIEKQWNETSHIRTRDDVALYRHDWEKFIETIIYELNGYFASGSLQTSHVCNVISDNIISILIERNKSVIGRLLEDHAISDSRIGAYIQNWWSGIKSEYKNDESSGYMAYAKSVILNWTARIIFAHIIKHRQTTATLIDNIDFETTPREANDIFERITYRCNFHNIFMPLEYDEILPLSSWSDFVEFSIFLRNSGKAFLHQEVLHNILENTVSTAKREINGQYATPSALAKILARITIRNWKDNVLDCCCGTGTISGIILKMKKKLLTQKDAVESVWACDKYRYPLQIANISMADADTVNLAARLFQHNALTLKTGEKISFVNPADGTEMVLVLPSFGAIIANLPFVAFENIDTEDIHEIYDKPIFSDLNEKSDLYSYIAIKISDVLKEGGLLGIILSNSWLGTVAGSQFIKALRQKYNIMQVHISGKGRWFKNAEVVTTIMVLEKKNDKKEINTDFWLWKMSLEAISKNADAEDNLVNSALLGKEIDSNIMKLSSYSQRQITEFTTLNVSYNALFHNIDWLLEISDKLVRIDNIFHIFRGSRRGWDKLFFPKKGEHNIEKAYLRKVLMNTRKIKTLMTTPDREAFCCSLSIDALKALGHFGAVNWIERFSCQTNGVGRPLPEVLSRNNMQWYELQENEIAEVFTPMNPEQRFFFSKFETPSFINQRLIGLNHRKEYPDLELNHALLNSMLTLFYVEASGFGRGLGVLDINKENIAKCRILNPQFVSVNDRSLILNAFEKIKNREIMTLACELNNRDRLEFELQVLRSFGIEKYFDKIKYSLLSMQEARLASKLPAGRRNS